MCEISLFLPMKLLMCGKAIISAFPVYRPACKFHMTRPQLTIPAISIQLQELYRIHVQCKLKHLVAIYCALNLRDVALKNS